MIWFLLSCVTRVCIVNCVVNQSTHKKNDRHVRFINAKTSGSGRK